jgi:hypothetical protein
MKEFKIIIGQALLEVIFDYYILLDVRGFDYIEEIYIILAEKRPHNLAKFCNCCDQKIWE